MMTEKNKAYGQLHLSVLLWGFTAILGKVILVPALTLVWWRMLITTFCLYVILLIFKQLEDVKKLPWRTIFKVAGIGWIVALHWLAFYGAIKLANSSVAVVCIATMSFFTALIEPFVLRTKFNWFEVGIGIIIIPAMALIVNDLDTTMLLGFVVGIIAALLSSIFSVFNKIMLKEVKPIPMTFIEIGSGGFLLTLLLPFFYYQNPMAVFYPTPQDWFFLVVLSIFCTVMPYVMSLFALQRLSAFTTVLALNLEPVYGVLLAWFLLQENKQLSTQFYVGVAILVGSIFVHQAFKSQTNVN
jgi:drug/metabolite transporter (DMT)-like permease